MINAKPWCNAINRSSRKPAIKIKTHVNKQQLRPRALPKIDVHAHKCTHATHTRFRTATPAEKSIFWAKLLPLTPLCESGLLPTTNNGMPHLARDVTRTKPYLLRNKAVFPLLSAGVVISRGYCVAPSCSDQSDESVARPRGAGRRP